MHLFFTLNTSLNLDLYKMFRTYSFLGKGRTESQAWVFREPMILTMLPYSIGQLWTSHKAYFLQRGNVNTSQVRQGSRVISTDSCQKVEQGLSAGAAATPARVKVSAAASGDWRRIEVGRVVKREGLTQGAWGSSCLSILGEDVFLHFHNQLVIFVRTDRISSIYTFFLHSVFEHF